MKGNGQTANGALSQKLAALADSDIEDLRRQWRRSFGKPAPGGLTRHLMVRILAWKLQVAAEGDLSSHVKKILREVAANMEANGPKAAVPPPPELRPILPGTQLAREHDGVLHRVTVLEKGFAWNGHVYPSLSKVAFAITGTRWNGPRFFGLREEPKRPGRRPAAAASSKAGPAAGSASAEGGHD